MNICSKRVYKLTYPCVYSTVYTGAGVLSMWSSDPSVRSKYITYARVKIFMNYVWLKYILDRETFPLVAHPSEISPDHQNLEVSIE